jgi:hypothetical protein
MSRKEKGMALSWGATPTSLKILDTFFFLRSWRPSEVDEIKNEFLISNLPILGSQKSLAFD